MATHTGNWAKTFLAAAITTAMVSGINICADDAAPAAPKDELKKEASDEGGQRAQMKKLESLHIQMQKLQRELQELQRQVLKDKPHLEEERDELTELAKSKAREKGYTPDKTAARLDELRGTLQEGNVSEDEKKELIAEYREKSRLLQAAQGHAMQDEEVQQAGKTFEQHMMAAMKEADPDVDKVIAELRAIQTRIQGLIQEIQQARGAQDQEAPDETATPKDAK